MQRVEIRVRGQIDRDWSDWLSNQTVTHTPDGETVITGSVRDQTALYGLLSRLANLGLELISLTSNDNNRPWA